MNEHTTFSPLWAKLLARVGLMLAGVAVALAVMLALVTAFPNLLPADLRDPLDQRTTNLAWDITYRQSDGDLFYHLPGDVKPPPDDAILSQHTVRWDAEGFRVPHITADDYPILVLGDSFTEAWMVADPWPDVLARQMGLPVRNLAYRGYGPLEYEAIMREYGGADHQWVLMGFFEGNDLQNIATSTERDTTDLLRDLVGQTVDPPDYTIVESTDGNYRYPLALYIGANFYELAFYDPYLWGLNGDLATYQDSRNLRVLGQVLSNIRQMSGEACLGLVYLPSKGHIYFQYTEPYGRRWILERGAENTIGAGGWLGDESLETRQGMPIDFDTLIGRMDNMRQAVQEVAQQNGWQFIDLTAQFQQAAAEGQMLYLTYDTHWNQDGQTLAGQLVADYLAQAGEGCGDANP